MAVKQYLFRLYHRPITEEFRDWSNVLQDNIQLTLNQFEIAYTDYPCSLPETTVDLAHQASMLAYCDALLTIQSEIWMIVVWQLTDEHGADHTTPVIVLHPYLDSNLAPPRFDGGDSTQYLPSFDFDGESLELNGDLYQRTGNGYHSYFLYDPTHGPGNNYQFPDPWTVANVARDTERGRYQLQMFKRAIAVEDYFLSQERNYVLNMAGSLASTRFPLWQVAIESLPNGHSGYSVNPDGKLVGQPQALTRRTLNGVSNLAQQRRMFIRREWAVSAVASEWYITQKKFMAWMWFNDQGGFQTAEVGGDIQMPDGTTVTLTATVVPVDFMQRNIAWIVDFLNLVNVAQGDTGLIAALPGLTETELHNEYLAVLEKLRGKDGVVSRYALSTLTDHISIFRHAVDLTTSIMQKIVAFRIALRDYGAMEPTNTAQQQLDRVNVYVTILNNFAAQWPGLVADFYSVFCLLCSWHLTWNVRERTRGADADDVLRNKAYPYTPKWQRRFLPVIKTNLEQPPDMVYFLSTARPVFAPFRTWDVALYNTGYERAAAELQEQQRQQAIAQKLQEQQQRAAAELAARQAQALAYRNEKRAEWQRLQLPNPDDVWDYRNFTSLDWWRQKAQEPLNREFTLRAIDVPNDIYTPFGVEFGLGRNAVPEFSRNLAAGGFNEKMIPAGAPVSALVLPAVLILINDRNLSTGQANPYWIIGDVAGLAANYLGTNDETYSPRQFWPPASFW
jgi:hypothetical protein